MSQRTTELARQASEAIRELNHLTIDTGHLPVPDAYTVIAELATLASRAAQLLQQLAANLERRQALGGLRLDAMGEQRYQTIEQATGEATTALRAGAGITHELAAVIAMAQNVTATIADTGPGERS